jgi:rod shape-determining protein MreD
MNRNIWISFLIRLFIVFFLQIFVFNYYEWLGSYLVCLVLYALVILPIPLPWYAGLIIAFLMGLLEDIFTTVQGLHAASFTFIALVRPSLVRLFLKNKQEIDMVLIDSTYLGWNKWALYVLFVVFMDAFIIFTLQYFSTNIAGYLLRDIVLQTLLNFVFVVAIEALMVSVVKKNS